MFELVNELIITEKIRGDEYCEDLLKIQEYQNNFYSLKIYFYKNTENAFVLAIRTDIEQKYIPELSIQLSPEGTKRVYMRIEQHLSANSNEAEEIIKGLTIGKSSMIAIEELIRKTSNK